MAERAKYRVVEGAGQVSTKEWTLETLYVHQEALRRADDKFAAERDLRYAEVNTEKEKALKIKETADLAALTLAREIQSYKDEKVEKSREQNLSERGEYVTRGDLDVVVHRIEDSLSPIFDFVAKQQGQRLQVVDSQTTVTSERQKKSLYVAAAVAVFSFAFGSAGILVGIYEMVVRG